MTLQVSPAQVCYDASLQRPRDEIQLHQIRLDDDGHCLGVFTYRRGQAIDEKFRGGPVGLDSLASAISEDPETVSVVIEPYLVQLNFIARTSQGRVITDLGRRYLKGHDNVSGGGEDVLF